MVGLMQGFNAILRSRDFKTMYADGSRNVGKGGCSPSRLIIINFSSITILSRMEAFVEALKLVENIIWHSLYKMKSYISDASDIFQK